MNNHTAVAFLSLYKKLMGLILFTLGVIKPFLVKVSLFAGFILAMSQG